MNTNVRWGRVYTAVLQQYEATLLLIGIQIFFLAFEGIPNITMSEALDLTWDAFVSMYHIGPSTRMLFACFPALFVGSLLVKKEERIPTFSLASAYSVLLQGVAATEGFYFMLEYWSATGTFQPVSPTYAQLTTALTNWTNQIPDGVTYYLLALAAFFMILDFGYTWLKNRKTKDYDYLD